MQENGRSGTSMPSIAINSTLSNHLSEYKIVYSGDKFTSHTRINDRMDV